MRSIQLSAAEWIRRDESAPYTATRFIRLLAGGRNRRDRPAPHAATRIVRLLAAAAAVLVVSQAAALAASAEKGKLAYVKNGCWQCHGFVGQGGAAGPKLAPDPMAAEALAAFVRFTNGPMPPYPEAVLSNGDLADIHAYLQSIKPVDYKSIPLLNQPSGK
jgi:mono/diheme cytochrome c family protein